MQCEYETGRSLFFCTNPPVLFHSPLETFANVGRSLFKKGQFGLVQLVTAQSFLLVPLQN